MSITNRIDLGNGLGAGDRIVKTDFSMSTPVLQANHNICKYVGSGGSKQTTTSVNMQVMGQPANHNICKYTGSGAVSIPHL